jgi:hypothetical protein
MGSRAAVFRAYVVAASGHGAYDALLGLRAPALAFSVLVVGVVVYVVLFRRALAASPYRHHQLRALPTAPPPHRIPLPGHRGTADEALLGGSPTSPRALAPNAVVPATGLPAWAQPDATSRLVGQLPPGLPVQVVGQLGAWAHVLTATGWSGWVDGRALVPIASQGAASPRP